MCVKRGVKIKTHNEIHQHISGNLNLQGGVVRNQVMSHLFAYLYSLCEQNVVTVTTLETGISCHCFLEHILYPRRLFYSFFIIFPWAEWHHSVIIHGICVFPVLVVIENCATKFDLKAWFGSEKMIPIILFSTSCQMKEIIRRILLATFIRKLCSKSYGILYHRPSTF